MKNLETLRRGLGGMFHRMLSFLPEPVYTRPRNTRLWDWMSEHAPGKLVLNVGSGVGQFDGLIRGEIRMINLDVVANAPDLDVVGDVHTLPFKDRSIDVVYSIAVLEHVRKPWIATTEITRVLKRSGHVVVELPFLNVIHDEHDYFRFTDKGIRSLFDENDYDVVLEQVGSGGGSFLSVFLTEYSTLLMPTRFLKVIWRTFMRYLFSLSRYLDLLVGETAPSRVTANSFTFIGRKR